MFICVICPLRTPISRSIRNSVSTQDKFNNDIPFGERDDAHKAAFNQWSTALKMFLALRRMAVPVTVPTIGGGGGGGGGVGGSGSGGSGGGGGVDFDSMFDDADLMAVDLSGSAKKKARLE
jgi:hypothetical protein